MTPQVMKEIDKLCFHRWDFSSYFLNASGAGNTDCLILMSAAILNMTTYQYEWQMLEQNLSEGKRGGTSNNIAHCLTDRQVSGL